jgi:multisubunit Na+/H+ antiporter MnhG subunit
MTDTMIWLGVAFAVVIAIWLAEPYHTHLIEKAHARKEAEEGPR